jgi:F0F1-type ATP synthase delta subunit
VFHVNRWAAAFLNTNGMDANGMDAAGTDAACDLERLKVLSAALKQASRRLSGVTAARDAEKLLRENTGAEFEKPIRFIALIISKNYFHRADAIIAAIESRLDEQMGILNVTVESASVTDSALEEKLREMIREKTGASGVRLRVTTAPELIAGYRMRIGGLCIDASLAKKLKKMAGVLADSGRAAAGAVTPKRSFNGTVQ